MEYLERIGTNMDKSTIQKTSEAERYQAIPFIGHEKM